MWDLVINDIWTRTFHILWPWPCVCGLNNGFPLYVCCSHVVHIIYEVIVLYWPIKELLPLLLSAITRFKINNNGIATSPYRTKWIPTKSPVTLIQISAHCYMLPGRLWYSCCDCLPERGGWYYAHIPSSLCGSCAYWLCFLAILHAGYVNV